MTPLSEKINTNNLIGPLRKSLARLESALAQVDEPIIIFDEDKNLEWCNKSFERLARKPRLLMLGKGIDHCLSAFISNHNTQSGKDLGRNNESHALTPLLNLIEGNFNIVLNQGRKQSYYECEIRKVDDSFDTKIVVLKNTDHLVVIDNLQGSLETCHLTGLYNRRGLTRHLETIFAEEKQSQLALIFFDLNKFKEVNDSYGHEVGDQVLKHFASQLKQSTRQYDIVSRLSGDEFVVAVSKINEKTAERVINSIIKRLAKLTCTPFHLTHDERDISIDIRASAGASLGSKARSAKELLSQADNAMYHAKQRSSSLHYYGKELEILCEQNKIIRDSTNYILQEGRIQFHLQPIFDINIRQCIGYEALMRPTSQTGIALPPLNFVQNLESSGHISEIDNVVVNSIINNKAVQHNLTRKKKLSINISAITLKMEGTARWIINQVLKNPCITAKQIIIEITETGFIDNLDLLKDEVIQLSSAGFTILLDDFGSGFTGFTQLLELPIHGFKIDQGLFQASLKFDKHSAVLQSLSFIANKMKLTVIVEGIETTEHESHMRSLGFHLAQGYSLGIPMPPEFYLTKTRNYDKSSLECLINNKQRNPFIPNHWTKD